jgi:uncharacterized integral membrane protein
MSWLWKVLLAALFLGVALLGLLAMMDNDTQVSLRFLDWSTPALSIYWWLLAALLIGASLGWTASAAGSVRTRLAKRQMRRELARSRSEVERLRKVEDLP